MEAKLLDDNNSKKSIIKVGDITMNLNKESIIDIINENIKKSSLNNFKVLGYDEEPMWEKPFIGFASGSDPYFEFLKKDIGDFYWTPKEAFLLKYPDSKIENDELTIISLVFPHTVATKQNQNKKVKEPTSRWIVTRGEWEPLMAEIGTNIVNELESAGIQAVAIDLLPELCWKISDKYGMAAKWSHRHSAFAAGLGTFGLSDGLITRKGKAMRCTTFLVKAPLEPDKREYEKYNEWCKFYSEGTCGVCINRCPAGAITEHGHDKQKCSMYEDIIKDKLIKEGKMNPDYIGSCGLCQCKVPCQDGIPSNNNM